MFQVVKPFEMETIRSAVGLGDDGVTDGKKAVESSPADAPPAAAGDCSKMETIKSAIGLGDDGVTNRAKAVQSSPADAPPAAAGEGGKEGTSPSAPPPFRPLSLQHNDHPTHVHLYED